jgi:hypothetical protein
MAELIDDLQTLIARTVRVTLVENDVDGDAIYSRWERRWTAAAKPPLP